MSPARYTFNFTHQISDIMSGSSSIESEYDLEVIS